MRRSTMVNPVRNELLLSPIIKFLLRSHLTFLVDMVGYLSLAISSSA